jgi:hypothetical protein
MLVPKFVNTSPAPRFELGLEVLESEAEIKLPPH